MAKTKKIRRNLFLFIKLILFIGVIYLLYRQLSRVEVGDWREVRIHSFVSLIFGIALVVVNIGLAYVKWHLTLKTIPIIADRKTSIHSFFAGIVTGLLTPNMLGNFIGRFYYFDVSKRGLITSLTMFANFGQFMASFLFGWVSLVIVGKIIGIGENNLITISVGIAILVAILIYFYAEYIVLKIWKKPFAKDLKLILHKNHWFRWKILLLAFARFIVFTSQYALVLHAFGEELTLLTILAIWQVYLITMIFPSLVLGKLGVKELIAVSVLGAIGFNEFSIVISSLIIWATNSLSPAIVGLIICKRPSV